MNKDTPRIVASVLVHQFPSGCNECPLLGVTHPSQFESYNTCTPLNEIFKFSPPSGFRRHDCPMALTKDAADV